ncbi:MAG: phosphate transport system regulatory protein PhoU [Robiginitomaculum sp.]|nr:MAG: phosphate transport system regulatory protein PhoU [Robiginitomaculum sp.]
MSKSHIVSSFNTDLKHLRNLVLNMGALVEQQVLQATTALKEEDRSIAKRVLGGDQEINALEAELNDAALKVLALRQPVAKDLRNVMMSLKIGGHLERIGDYAKNMARRTNTITKADAFTGSIGTIVHMSELVQSMVSNALKAYNMRDIELAEYIRAQDENVDQMLNTLFRELLTYMMEDPRNISGCMHLLFIAKNFERMGDHVVEIAQEIIFLVTGNWPLEKRAKYDKTSKMIVTPNDLENN